MVAERVLGSRVDCLNRVETLALIGEWLAAKQMSPKLIVTAYSEFFVTALRDPDFRMALEGSDLVLPDGVGPLAAIRYRSLVGTRDSLMYKLLVGSRVGLEVLRGRVGETVPGYWLFDELVGSAAKDGRRVFLLGGFGDTAEKTKRKLLITNDELLIMADEGAQMVDEMTGKANEAVIEKINRFQPDLLFVAYGPVKQEKWLAANLRKIKTKVAIGVGGTFDEYLGKVRPAPEMVSLLGLKWLWRLIQQPSRMRRIWNAVVVFPWLVFREK